ncbi:perlucin, partial [Biomphalaria pfeifferi]
INVILDNTKVLAKGTLTNNLYYISKSPVTGFNQAKDWCTANGEGYPAEIDTFEEFPFLESLVKPNSGLRVFIEGTDAKKDGIWVSLRIGTQLNVFDWSSGEPNNYLRPEECLELMADRAGKLNNVP